jgi:hypothetical protein
MYGCPEVDVYIPGGQDFINVLYRPPLLLGIAPQVLKPPSQNESALTSSSYGNRPHQPSLHENLRVFDYLAAK